MLVGKHQENGVSELVLIQHALQFLPCLNNTIAIIAVNDKDDTLSVLKIVSPKGSDLVLSTNIPYGKLNILVFDGLDVESYVNKSATSLRDSLDRIEMDNTRTNGWNGCNDFTKL